MSISLENAVVMIEHPQTYLNRQSTKKSRYKGPVDEIAIDNRWGETRERWESSNQGSEDFSHRYPMQDGRTNRVGETRGGRKPAEMIPSKI